MDTVTGGEPTESCAAKKTERNVLTPAHSALESFQGHVRSSFRFFLPIPPSLPNLDLRRASEPENRRPNQRKSGLEAAPARSPQGAKYEGCSVTSVRDLVVAWVCGQ